MILSSMLMLAAGLSTSLPFPPPFDPAIEWDTIDAGGGEVSTGGVWELTGTIGQPDAQRYAGGGIYSVVGGFWERGSQSNSLVADINGDDTIDLEDFFLFFNLFDATDNGADVNQDGAVDLADFFEFLNAFDGSY